GVSHRAAARFKPSVIPSNLPSFPRKRESSSPIVRPELVEGRSLVGFALREVSRCNKLTCGSRTAVGVLFFACPKKSTQKKDTPVAAPLEKSTQAVPCAPHQPRARAELAGAHKDNSARSGSNIVSRRLSGLAAVLGWLYGEELPAPMVYGYRRSSYY